MLPGTKEFSAAAQKQVFFRQSKSILYLRHEGQTEFCGFAGIVRIQDTVGFSLAAPYPSTQLMKLRQTKSVSTIYKHDGGIRYINPYFNYTGCHQHLNFALYKGFHYLIFFSGFHLSMHKPKAEFRKLLRPEFLIHRNCRCQIRLFTFLHKRADHVYLVPHIHFLFHKPVNTRQHISPNCICPHRLSSRR